MRTDALRTLPGVIGVAAASVDPAIAEILAEVTGLEQQLQDLNAEAVELERQVEASTHHALDADTALPLLERVFAEHESRVRNELRAALEQAVGDADRLMAAARVEADAILAGAASASPFSVDSAAPFAPAHDVADPRTSAAPVAPVAPHDPAPEPTLLARPEPAPEPDYLYKADLRPEAPTTDPVDRESFVAPTMVLVSSIERTSTPAQPAEADAEPAAFGQFWEPQPGQQEPRNLRPTILDAVLPLLAVAIVLVVVLSWMG